VEIIKQNPPNIKEIKKYLNPPLDTVYCFGNIIYNPSGKEIPAEIEYHEQIHAKQQKLFMSPELWWTKYLTDQEFRLDQEIEAYTRQWMFIYKHIPQAKKDALEDISDNLSSPMYNIGKTKHEVATLIRLKAKEYAIT